MAAVVGGVTVEDEAAVAADGLGPRVQRWLLERLWPKGIHRPTCKRLAVLTAGLLETRTVQRGALSAAVARLHLSAAKEASIARRLERLLADPALDPERVLPLVQADLLPTLLAEVVEAHAVSAAQAERRHARWYPLTVIVDETTVRDQVHVLAAGLAYQGIAVPLAVRTWPQNQALAPGEYWRQLHALLADVQAALPPVLREHVVLAADRGYGVSRMIDLAEALGWAWVLRLKASATLTLADGRAVTAASRAPRPGTVRVYATTRDQVFGFEDPAPNDPVAVFGKADRRPCRVVAVWAEGADEPWLLATNLAGSGAEFLVYAHRWAIERLFLHWKSHGWDLELLHAPTPARTARLLTGLVLATWWTLAIGLAHTTTLLATAARPAPRQPVLQPHLPGCAPVPRDPRPWPAKRSLLTWGRCVLATTVTALHTPPQRWAFPDWHLPTWQAACLAHWPT